MLNDLRVGLRLLWKDKAFTLTAALTLALCIGANTALFSVVHNVLLRPLNVPESDRIVLMGNAYPGAGFDIGGSAVDRLTTGPIAQPGIAYTIIASRADALVTPTTTAFVREPGVHNFYVQDTCPFDQVGHIGMAFDPGIATMIGNALDPAHAKPVVCGFGPPF